MVFSINTEYTRSFNLNRSLESSYCWHRFVRNAQLKTLGIREVVPEIVLLFPETLIYSLKNNQLKVRKTSEHI